MVYFGAVRHGDGGQHLVRGVTVSHSHIDHDYTVGTYRDYDIALVLRRDRLTYPDKRVVDHSWLIMTFDLHTLLEVPHCYVSPTHRSEILLAKYTRLSPLTLTNLAPHSAAFMQQFTVYASVEHAIVVEQLLPPETTAQLVQSFADISIELSDNTLYIYMHEKHPSRPQLERMLTSGLWLAQTLDANARQILLQAR